MNQERIERFDAIARLFRYPGEDYASEALALAKRLERESSRATAPMREFARYASRTPLDELEETYTRTFDLNPSCSPEIGWHLFGEEYVRGLFMVRMRNEMRERGLEETGELPDHVVHVLAVLSSMDEEPARKLAQACLCPALGKMLQSFERADSPPKPTPKKPRDLLPHGLRQEPEELASIEQESGNRWSQSLEQPFRSLVLALSEVVLEEFDLPEAALIAKEEEPSSPASGIDPLHSMPCGGCGGPPSAAGQDLDLHQIQENALAGLPRSGDPHRKENRP